jgi:PAS domain S-box-containing protein
MSKEAAILLLEDSSVDAELIERELRRGGIGFVAKRLATEDAFAQAIKNAPPDLILADYQLGGFTGLEALAMARQQCPDVPFILVSGVCGEELAIDALVGGATDYILKDRLYRLAPAARHALEIADRRRAERAARETERKFFALTETLPAIVFVHQDGKFRYLNPAAERILGYSSKQLLSMNFWDVIHPEFRELVRERGLSRQQGAAVPSRYEFPIVSGQGETRWLDCTATQIDFEGLPAVLGSAFDVTEAKRVAEALRESEQRFRLLVGAMPDFIFRLRADGTILDFNAPKDADFPIGIGEVLGQTLLGLAPQRLVEPARYYVERTLQTGETHAFEFQFPLRGQVRDFEARVTVCGADEVLAIVRDVTERKRLEKEVLEISARERRRFGHDLHDGLGQFLAGIAMKAKILEDALARESSAHKSAAKKLVRLINNAIHQARSLARGLAPIEVEVSGLAPALQKLARETEDRFGIVCRVHTSQPFLPVNKTASLQLYRIVQEAITNAVRHGQARRIEIDLTTDALGLRLCVRDDGRGFTNPPRVRTGMGLRIMEHRVHAIGGALTIASDANRGTEVRCVLPLTPGATDEAAGSPPPP